MRLRAFVGASMVLVPWWVCVGLYVAHRDLLGGIAAAVASGFIYFLAHQAPEVRYEHPQIEPEDEVPDGGGDV